MVETRRTCKDEGREHTWERRGTTQGDGAIVFRCSTCTAWGWATMKAPKQITQYTTPFVSREPKPEQTVQASWERPDDARQRGPSRVDVRADRPKRTKGEYSPRFGLDDWDRGVGYRRRGE
ncbi:MAG TPA: hypothetical protein VGG39_15845 [Polyangiaceae bacterium]|jgi:hypothetical protein